MSDLQPEPSSLASATTSITQTTKPTGKDPTFKRLIQTYFEQEQLIPPFTVTPGLQVGQLQLEIDVVISATETDLKVEELQASLTATPFWFFDRLNLVEFKSISDPLNKAEFARITARANMAWADQHDEARDSMLSCIISAAWPHKFLSNRFGGRRFRPVKGRPGFWFHPGLFFPVYLIVCNKLPLEEANYPLLVFSSGEKLRHFLEQIAIDSRMDLYFNYVARLHPNEAAEVYTRRRSVMSKTQIEKAAKIFYETIGPEELLKLIGPERLAELIDPQQLEQIIKLIGPERLVELIGPERLTEMLGLKK